MIEVVLADRCIGCDRCAEVCPTSVFDVGEDGIPTIARQSDCQTCFQCEAHCPVDALYVHPQTRPTPVDADEVGDLVGSYRQVLGWGGGRTAGARLALDLEDHADHRPPV